MGIAVMVCVPLAFGQTSRSHDEDLPAGFEESVSKAISFFAPLLLPKILQDDSRLREFIKGDELDAIRRQNGDLQGVDAIFREALRLSWDNVYEALFISFIGTFDHRRFGVRFPLVGAFLWFPLTSEFPDDFQARVNSLPSQLYPDTPPGKEGDRDKLQHFFGSAFLTYLLGSRGPAERLGSFIEWGEDKFVVDGELDERDFRANREGQEFGLHLLRSGEEPPSTFLRIEVARHPCAIPTGSAGELPDSVYSTLEER